MSMAPAINATYVKPKESGRIRRYLKFACGHCTTDIRVDAAVEVFPAAVDCPYCKRRQATNPDWKPQREQRDD